MKKSRRFDRPSTGGRRSSPPPAHGSKKVTPEGRCVVGLHAVSELLTVRARAVGQLWIRENYVDHPGLNKVFEIAKAARVKVLVQPPTVMDRVANVHQGVLAFALEEPEVHWGALEKAETATVVALDEVEDPHNLGAVLRTTWLLDGKAVFTPEHRAVHLSPAVSKVAQGAVEHVPVVRDGALPQQLEQLKKMGFWILGLSHKAKQGLYTLDIPDKVAWVLGAESSGLRKSVEGVCDDLIAIPQSVAEASYNVSVAAALALGETFRQRQVRREPGS